MVSWFPQARLGHGHARSWSFLLDYRSGRLGCVKRVHVDQHATGLQKFAENLEDKLRRKAVSPATIREAFQLISAADRVLSGVSSAGKQILSELGEAFEGPGEGGGRQESGGDEDAGSERGGRKEGKDQPL